MNDSLDARDREIGRLASHNQRLQEEICSQRRQMDRQAAEIVRLERTTLQPVAGYLAARALLEQADKEWIDLDDLRNALDSPF